MKTVLFLILFFTAFELAMVAQAPACRDLHNGITYTYGANSTDEVISIMDKNKLTQVVVNLDDTVCYRVDWIDECSFSMQYVSGGSKVPEKIINFNANHIFYYSVEKITEEYFIGKIIQDRPKGRMLGKDTSWFAPKQSMPASNDFQKVSGRLVDAKTSFDDSAGCALVYIYRPKKTMLLLATYPLFFDGQLMCTIQNNAGYIFKVKKEGRHLFTTKLLQDSATIALDLHFGNKYYIRPWIEWGLKPRLYNFKLHIEEISDRSAAEKEFAEVKLK
jgi:hypothetical protein